MWVCVCVRVLVRSGLFAFTLGLPKCKFVDLHIMLSSLCAFLGLGEGLNRSEELVEAVLLLGVFVYRY